ncbi:MAG: GIY-YIG nuclease family protein, partial [Proteobacteria bacterium]
MPLPNNLPSQLGWLRNERLQFSPAAEQMLGHYVYMLLHPDDGRVFYVGEGQRQRVFDHLLKAVQLISDGALQMIEDDEADPEHSEKLGTIAKIIATKRLPLMHIVRDGMDTQEEAQRVEGALIDVLDYLAALNQIVPPLTNQLAGRGVASFRTVNDVEATHGESFSLADLPDLKVDESVLFVNVNRRWGEVVAGQQSLLEIAQGRWRLAPARAAQCRYVVA